MKVLKGKYEGEINTRKELEEKKAQADSLAESLETENRNLRSQIKQFEQGDDKEKGSSEDGEDITAKQKLKELEAKVQSLSAEKAELEEKLQEAVKNEETSSAAAMVLNDQVRRTSPSLHHSLLSNTCAFRSPSLLLNQLCYVQNERIP